MPCHRIRNNYTCALAVCLALAAESYPALAQDAKVIQEKAKQEKSEPANKKAKKADGEEAEKAMSKKEKRQAERADPCRVEHDLPGCAKATNKSK